MKTQRILLILILSTFSIISCNKQGKQTEVLVVGTIHSGHQNNPNYSYQDLVNILDTYNPDAICVEIPPSYFRKRSYLKEMMIATIYGTDNNKKVYPIDWWKKTNARAEQQAYKKTEDYKQKNALADSLIKDNSIMQGFIQKYGNLNNIWKENTKSYEFFNGKDYNNYIREMYNISIKVFGNSCINLYSEERNAKMMQRIDSAIMENKGKRIIVLTGAEHKYYFDIVLANKKNVKQLAFDEILPLKATTLDKNLANFIENNLAKGYYDTSNIDLMYHGALVPLLHGLNMDGNPSIISTENIEKAKKIIADWKKENPNSVYLQFEKAWVAFLEKDYKKAIKISENIINKLDKIPENKRRFVQVLFWRNLGFCYDLTGERAKAIQAYQEGKKVCDKFNLNENFIKRVFKNFEEEPYNAKAL